MIHALLIAVVIAGGAGLVIGYLAFGAILASAYAERHPDMGAVVCCCLWPVVVMLAFVLAIGRAAWWAATVEEDFQ
jgi:hypothetical protein